MGVFKNGVGRPSNETIKKRNIFKGICLLLILIIIGLVCYIVKINSNITKVNNGKSELNDNKEVERLDVNDKTVTGLFNKMNAIDRTQDLMSFDGEKDYYAYFYSKDKTELKDVEDNVKFAIAVQDIGNQKEKLSKKEISDKVKETFGTDIEYANKYYAFGNEFRLENGNYVKYEPGIGAVAGIDTITKIVKAEKKDNDIIIYNKVAFVLAGMINDDENEACEVYKDASNSLVKIFDKGLSGKLKDCGEKEFTDVKQINIKDVEDKLDTFKWTFTKDSNDNYVFTSVEKVK